MRENLAVKNLKEVKEVFDKLNVKYWLDWGTLLGAVRDGKIIEWDHDIDLGTMDTDLERITSAFPELQRRGFNVQFWNLKFTKGIYLDRFEHLIGITPYNVKSKCASTSTFLWPKNLIGHSLYVLYSILLFPEALVIVQSKFKFIAKVLGSCLSLLPPEVRSAFSVFTWLILRRTCNRLGQIVVPKHFFEKLETIEFYGMPFNIPSDVEVYLEYHYGKDWKTPKKEWKFEMDNTVKAFITRASEY